MTPKPLLINEEIFNSFEGNLGFFSVVGQDSPGKRCSDVPQLNLGTIPVYSFAFLTSDGQKFIHHVVISSFGAGLQFWKTEDPPSILGFVKQLGDSASLYDPVSVIDLTTFIYPIDVDRSQWIGD